jgi:mannose-1-phosphate guanylyltransferase/mannose-6-phosphate isomerase
MSFLEIKPIILCGGSGTRLWPLSSGGLPKQFIPLIDGFSLFDLTLRRVNAFGPVSCIANATQFDHFQSYFTDISGKKCIHNVLLEPASRDTTAAIASSLFLPNLNDSDLLLFLPSDHLIGDVDNFISTVKLGVDIARAGYIVTFGITPTFPSPAYGYIQKGEQLEINGISSHSYSVSAFIEKPTVEDAEVMLATKEYFWNAGIFLCEVSVVRDALCKHAKDIFDTCKQAMSSAKIKDFYIYPNEIFLKARSESFDYSVMEKFEKVAVVPYLGDWSDVGNWDSVSKLVEPDDHGNRVLGYGKSLVSTNTYIHSTNNRLVVSLGTTDLIIVDTPDAVLVSTLSQVENVKKVVASLNDNDLAQVETPGKVIRPWGWFDTIDSGERFQVKRILVKPKSSISLQMHRHRAEHWIVVKGVAKVTNGDVISFLHENESTYIPIGVKHRLENLGDIDLEMIEVQSGNYLGEDDIIRFDDMYGRT